MQLSILFKRAKNVPFRKMKYNKSVQNSEKCFFLLSFPPKERNNNNEDDYMVICIILPQMQIYSDSITVTGKILCIHIDSMRVKTVSVNPPFFFSCSIVEQYYE